MKFASLVIAIAALAVASADAASARPKHHRRAQCVDQPYRFSWSFLLPGQRAPQPNGCAPPVYAYGKYVGQDTDPNIRHQLLRDPATGYWTLSNP